MNHTTPLIHLEIALSTLIPIVLIGVMLPLLGRTRRGVLFGVTVPLDFATSPVARESLRRYRTRSASLAIAALLAASVCVFFGSALTMSIATLVAILFELTASMLLLLQEHRIIKPYGVSVPIVRTAELRSHNSLAPIIATAAAEIPLALEALWLRLNWNRIPAQWPEHWNAAGEVNGWGHRTLGGVFGPLLMGAIILLTFILIAIFMVKTPGTQTRQRARMAIPIAALAWIMSALFCFVGLLPIKHDITVGSIMLISIAYMVATFAISIWLLLRSSTMPGTLAAEPYDGTPDAMWRAGGLIYFNPTDAAVLVPKRYGWGWTLNFARPIAWFYIGGILSLTVIAGILPLFLH